MEIKRILCRLAISIVIIWGIFSVNPSNAMPVLNSRDALGTRFEAPWNTAPTARYCINHQADLDGDEDFDYTDPVSLVALIRDAMATRDQLEILNIALRRTNRGDVDAFRLHQLAFIASNRREEPPYGTSGLEWVRNMESDAYQVAVWRILGQIHTRPTWGRRPVSEATWNRASILYEMSMNYARAASGVSELGASRPITVQEATVRVVAYNELEDGREIRKGNNFGWHEGGIVGPFVIVHTIQQENMETLSQRTNPFCSCGNNRFDNRTCGDFGHIQHGGGRAWSLTEHEVINVQGFTDYIYVGGAVFARHPDARAGENPYFVYHHNMFGVERRNKFFPKARS